MLAVDRRLFKSFDWMLLWLTLAIIILGLPVMFSASQGKEGSTELFNEHLLRLAIGLAVMTVAVLVDYRFIARWAYLLYGLNLAALVLTAVGGVVGFGARRWLQLGPVALQPSEMFKITLILTLAWYMSRARPSGELGWGQLGAGALFLALPFLLIVKQPDLGTAVITALIFASMLAVGGISSRTWRSLLLWSSGLAAAVILVFQLGLVRLGDFLKPYQVQRITVLFDSDQDPLGASYHINQSKIAIGSGGLLGKGFMNGSQNQLRFLPQQHTDFIFSVLAEEWGFVGVTLALALYLLLLLRALQAAEGARDRLGSLICLGVASMIFFHAVVNIGMTVGFMPVVGLPLPLMSYGGSSFMVAMAGIGLMLNVRMRRF